MLSLHLAVAVCAVIVARAAVAAEEAPTAPPADAEVLFQKSQEWLEAGDFLRARDGFAAAWKGFETRYGGNSARTQEARIFLGQLHTMTGHPELALNLLAPMIRQPGRLGLIASGSFALALRQGGQPDRAIEILRETIPKFRAESPDDLIHVGRFYSELAVSYAYLKRYREGEQAARQALEQLELAGGPPRPHRACVLTVLGQIQLLSRQDRAATETLAEAERAAAPFWNEWHPEMAILQGALGVLAYRRGDYVESERRVRSALAATERLLGPDHGEVAMISQQLAATLKKLKRKDEARQLEARAQGILARAAAGAPTVSIHSFR